MDKKPRADGATQGLSWGAGTTSHDDGGSGAIVSVSGGAPELPSANIPSVRAARRSMAFSARSRVSFTLSSGAKRSAAESLWVSI